LRMSMNWKKRMLETAKRGKKSTKNTGFNNTALHLQAHRLFHFSNFILGQQENHFRSGRSVIFAYCVGYGGSNFQ
jgi:hypothetical protein